MKKIILLSMLFMFIPAILTASQINGGSAGSVAASDITAGTLASNVIASSVAVNGAGTNQLQQDVVNRNEGLISDVAISDATGSAINISSCKCLLRSTTYFGDSKLYLKTISGNSALAMTDDSINFVYVDWNGGSPQYNATTNRDLINNATIIPVARVYMESGNIEYKMTYGKQGLSNSIKNFDRVMRIRGIAGIERESGYAVACSTVYTTIESGKAWFGMYRISNGFIGQSGTNTELYTHNAGGNWISTKVSTIPTTWYDTLTGTSTLTANRYAVIWVFRNLNAEEIDIVLGTGDYTLAQAQASQIPTLPDKIQYFYTICGKIIIQKSATSPISVQSVTNTTFTSAPTNNHSSLTGLSADDHPQYPLVDGTRGFTGNLNISSSVYVTGNLKVNGTVSFSSSGDSYKSFYHTIPCNAYVTNKLDEIVTPNYTIRITTITILYTGTTSVDSDMYMIKIDTKTTDTDYNYQQVVTVSTTTLTIKNGNRATMTSVNFPNYKDMLIPALSVIRLDVLHSAITTPGGANIIWGISAIKQ